MKGQINTCIEIKRWIFYSLKNSCLYLLHCKSPFNRHRNHSIGFIRFIGFTASTLLSIYSYISPIFLSTLHCQYWHSVINIAVYVLVVSRYLLYVHSISHVFNNIMYFYSAWFDVLFLKIKSECRLLKLYKLLKEKIKTDLITTKC